MCASADLRILRDLAKRYAEAAAHEKYDERRDLWRRHNALERTRPPIYVRWTAAWWTTDMAVNEVEDPFFRQHETFLRQMLFQDTIGDDYVLEPYIVQNATRVTPAGGLWGVPYNHTQSTEKGGAWKFDSPIKELDDVEKLVTPEHIIDEEDTARNVARIEEALGDILPVALSRRPALTIWRADISYEIAQLRGLEQVMWDMVDNAEWLHALLARLRDGVLAAHEKAEQNGDWRLCDHENQAMPYALELDDPSDSAAPVARKDLWCFTAAQEFAQVSPAMHDEFLLQYQLPIMSAFGLVAYGCCEDLTNKISYLRKIPNLRRIAVTPWADVAKCAEQIGTDYVMSWRPNPSDTICMDFDADHVKDVVRSALEASKGCHVDITLKDTQTFCKGPESLPEWVQAVRSVSDDYA